MIFSKVCHCVWSAYSNETILQMQCYMKKLGANYKKNSKTIQFLLINNRCCIFFSFKIWKKRKYQKYEKQRKKYNYDCNLDLGNQIFFVQVFIRNLSCWFLYRESRYFFYQVIVLRLKILPFWTGKCCYVSLMWPLSSDPCR